MGCKNMEKCKLIKAKLRRIGNSMGVILPANVITGYNKGDVITLDVITKDADVITPVEDANMLDLETVEGINDRPRVRPSSDWHSPEGESICKDLLSQLGEKPKTRQELIQHVSDVGGEVSYVKRDGKIEDVHIAKPQNKNPMMVGYDPLAEDE